MTNTPVLTIRRALGERAFACALQLGKTKGYNLLKRELIEFARENKRKKTSIGATAALAEKLFEAVRAGRMARACRRTPKRFFMPVPKFYIFPKGTLGERLARKKWQVAEAEKMRELNEEKAKVAALRSALENALGSVSHSSPTSILQNATSLAEVKACVNSYHDGYYSGSKKWPLIRHKIVATVCPNWQETVENKGLTSIHGIVTLAAQIVENEREGEEIFRAIWARKTKGANLSREEGYIIRRGAEIAHGATISGTRAVLSRRETEKKLDRIEGEILRRLENNQLNGASDLAVTIGDSLRAGNCEPGTLAFRDRHFPNRESATVKEVLSVANSFGDRRFAVAACVKALRRHHYCPVVD